MIASNSSCWQFDNQVNYIIFNWKSCNCTWTSLYLRPFAVLFWTISFTPSSIIFETPIAVNICIIITIAIFRTVTIKYFDLQIITLFRVLVCKIPYHCFFYFRVYAVEYNFYLFLYPTHGPVRISSDFNPLLFFLCIPSRRFFFTFVLPFFLSVVVFLPLRSSPRGQSLRRQHYRVDALIRCMFVADETCYDVYYDVLQLNVNSCIRHQYVFFVSDNRLQCLAM